MHFLVCLPDFLQNRSLYTNQMVDFLWGIGDIKIVNNWKIGAYYSAAYVLGI